MKYRKTAVALGVTAVIVLGVRMVLPGPPPSDSEMLDAFRGKRAAFDELALRLCALPHSQAVRLTGTGASSPPLALADQEEYDRLLEDIGSRVAQAVQMEEGCGVEIMAWATGLGGSGDSKGYDYRLRVHEPEAKWRDSLDEVDGARPDTAFFYRRIDDDWSLYFYHWP